MKKSFRLLSDSTYIKYFVSYLLILTLLIVGFFFIIRNQLTSRYFAQRCQHTSIQLADFSQQLATDIIYLSQLDTVIQSDYDLQPLRVEASNESRRLAYIELKEYATSTKLIQNIIFLPGKTSTPITTDYNVYFDEGVFHVYFDSETILTLDTLPYMDAPVAQLISVSELRTPKLLYFPQTSSSSSKI